MSHSEIARMLGRRGGLKRAQRLSKARRVEIARLGSQARADSRRLEQAIRNNFDYVAAIRQLQPPVTVSADSKVAREPGNRREPVDFIRAVGELLNDLAKLGHLPTLVGGMALVTLGSKRVTKDFDFLIDEEAREQNTFIQVFYKHGFQLVSKIDRSGDVVRTIDNQKIASARLRIDKPKSAYFYNHTLALRVDLLFDFPVSARGVHERAVRKKIQSYSFRIASREDLIAMKEVAARDRNLSSDLQDLEFLREE